jgi:hypothetical protein
VDMGYEVASRLLEIRQLSVKNLPGFIYCDTYLVKTLLCLAQGCDVHEVIEYRLAIGLRPVLFHWK